MIDKVIMALMASATAVGFGYVAVQAYVFGVYAVSVCAALVGASLILMIVSVVREER